MTVFSPRRLALTLAILVFATGCDGFDSGRSPNAPAESNATVSFETESISITESRGPVTVPVTISNPPGSEVTVEVLYAGGASSAGPSDFSLSSDAAVGGTGYLAGTVTFPDTASDGNTQTLELNIQDEEDDEPEEDGVFVLQNVQGNASIGERNRLTVTIGAIEIFNKNFSGEELSPMTVVDVTNGNGWGVGSNEGNFYAVANAFGGSEASDSWLITPSFNFNNFQGETISFRNAKNFDDGGVERGLQVKVSTDYDGSGNPGNFTWTDISDQVESYSPGEYEFVSSGEIDLSGSQFQGDEVYIAFRYISSGTGGGSSEQWQVDDIRVVVR